MGSRGSVALACWLRCTVPVLRLAALALTARGGPESGGGAKVLQHYAPTGRWLVLLLAARLCRRQQGAPQSLIGNGAKGLAQLTGVLLARAAGGHAVRCRVPLLWAVWLGRRVLRQLAAPQRLRQLLLWPEDLRAALRRVVVVRRLHARDGAAVRGTAAGWHERFMISIHAHGHTGSAESSDSRL